MKGSCKCLHHGVATVLVWLAWLSGIGFVWAIFFNQSLLNWDSNNFFQSIVVIGVLIYLSNYCSCCNNCVHGSDCNTCK